MIVSSLLLLVLSYKVFFGPQPSEITLNRLNIVDSRTGKLRMVLADIVPDPVIGGKTVPRIFKAGGLTYYNDKGNEVGGLVIVNDSSGEKTLLTFDYNNTDAFSIFKNETLESYQMGIQISDRNTQEEFERRGSRGTGRIGILNNNKTALIGLNDTRARPRIIFMVDANDNPRILVLDTLGKPVLELPRK